MTTVSTVVPTGTWVVDHARTPTAQRRRELRGGARDRLTPGVERELVLAGKSGGAAERDQLVTAFLPLIGSVARIYRGCGRIQRDELVQEGVVGLLRAIERFDPERGTPFWMYASWWVRQAMQRLVSELSQPVVLSDRALRKLARISDAQHEMRQRQCRRCSPADIATVTGLPRNEVDALLAAWRSPRSLESPLRHDNDASVTLGDQLEDPHALEPFDRVAQQLDSEQLPQALGVLDEREQTIIRARYGLDRSTCTLAEVGVQLGVSAERVPPDRGELARKAARRPLAAAAAPLRPRRGSSPTLRESRAGSTPRRTDSTTEKPMRRDSPAACAEEHVIRVWVAEEVVM